jgi:hypothetical protein
LEEIIIHPLKTPLSNLEEIIIYPLKTPLSNLEKIIIYPLKTHTFSYHFNKNYMLLIPEIGFTLGN